MKDDRPMVASRVDLAVYERLNAIAQEEDRSVSAVIRRIVDQYFDRMDANDDE